MKWFWWCIRMSFQNLYMLIFPQNIGDLEIKFFMNIFKEFFQMKIFREQKPFPLKLRSRNYFQIRLKREDEKRSKVKLILKNTVSWVFRIKIDFWSMPLYYNKIRRLINHLISLKEMSQNYIWWILPHVQRSFWIRFQFKFKSKFNFFQK